MPKNINTIIITLVFMCGLLIASSAFAQMEFLVNGYEEKYFNHDEGVGVEISSGEVEDATDIYIYEEPTVEAFSHMYWGIGMYETSDNFAIDEFLRINECDLYKKFSSDDFEWSEIRKATKVFIENNKMDFPTRFKFIMPLQLFNYSSRHQGFELMDEYKIIASRRLELYSSNHRAKPCNSDHHIDRGYPRALHVEFSRPFNLTHIPMTSDVAKAYVKKTSKIYHSVYDEKSRSRGRMYMFRKAYLVLKIKIFAHGAKVHDNRARVPIVKMMGILESYSIFEDRELTKLFYKKSYISNKKKGSLNLKLKEQYELLREKSKGDGMLN